MSTAKKHRIGHPEKLGLVTRAWHRDDADEQSTVVIPSALPLIPCDCMSMCMPGRRRRRSRGPK